MCDSQHGLPLVSLAALSSLEDVAEKLIELGADPLKLSSVGRTVLYIIVEKGSLALLNAVLAKHPHIDLNAPTTTETDRYCYDYDYYD